MRLLWKRKLLVVHWYSGNGGTCLGLACVVRVSFCLACVASDHSNLVCLATDMLWQVLVLVYVVCLRQVMALL